MSGRDPAKRGAPGAERMSGDAHMEGDTRVSEETSESEANARPGADVIARLHEARVAEKAQALFYRGLTGQAEIADDAVAAERLNGLLADEQHHLSRITARLLELGQAVEDLGDMEPPSADLSGWEPAARERELAEIARYETLGIMQLDGATRHLIDEILTAERKHENELGGKWMMA